MGYNNPGATKRQKELARQEWQREKAAKRKQRKLDREKRASLGESTQEIAAPEQ